MKILSDDILYQTIVNRDPDSYKGNYGKVTLIGGNDNYGGAIIMASLATINAGAGLVTTATTYHNLSSLHNHCLEAMFIDISDQLQVIESIKKSNVVLIGPGLGTDQMSLEILKVVLATISESQTLIIDGSAITLMAKYQLSLPEKSTNILTPHQMEWQRFSKIPIDQQTTENNQKYVSQLNAIVIVKSHHSEIYYQDQAFKLMLGNPGQAIGGMGDTLAGIIAGFTAQFQNKLDATLAGVYIHSLIADDIAKNNYIVLPHLISEKLPQYMYKYKKNQ
ncbi:NAD(P)H-hydrate dehydratase [Lentilactobacillus laojiaonis]|uniref:NAD(P)H-hydrate dehydratase n=1 Tax=Lentilactobacillus laojiaonis TaxID=2883998 RepID=UPI001D0ABD7B|nr:NAD(P)H-hydrate dehydratase [Lentilactobacillus laojiaonis]UDM32541.1 NAD(P)H-hydrate dehydratase [Lentilactobacillus laojiaonis]